MNQVQRSPRVLVLGAGVIGTSTALCLRSIGADVTIAGEPSAEVPLAWKGSTHAAASIIPHSVKTPHALRWTLTTQRVLRSFLAAESSGLRINRHYELFEDPSSPVEPDYVDALKNVERVSTSSHNLPIGRAKRSVVGWSFDCVFAENPTYLSWLRHVADCNQVGRSINPRPSDFDAVFVCVGSASRHVLETCFDDKVRDELWPRLTKETFVVGHYYLSGRTDLPLDVTGQPISYSYSALNADHRNLDGSNADVYCYPRRSGWQFGGTRLAVATRSDADALTDPHRSGGFPLGYDLRANLEEMVRLNRQLVAGLSSVSESGSATGSLRHGVGIRHQTIVDGNPEVLLRAGAMRGGGPLVVVNCGHGGAGFTLSWGSARDAVQLAIDRGAVSPADLPLTNELHTIRDSLNLNV